MNQIEKTQIKMIHVAIHQLGLSDEAYREILQGQFGKTSCKDLSFGEAHALIEYLKTLGFKVKGRKCGWCAPRVDRGKLPANVQFLVSPEQTSMIIALRGQIQWRYPDGYERWLSKYAKTDMVRTSLQASRVIEGLKGILRSQADCRGCKAIKF